MSAPAESPVAGWYRRSDPGSPDRFLSTHNMRFFWEGCPEWAWRLPVGRSFLGSPSGNIYSMMMHDRPAIACEIKKGFYFSVSVAPNFESALPGAAVHDWIYAHADAIAQAWGCSVWRVLKLADHWFLAVLRTSRFGFRRTYFIAVRGGGFFFNRIGKILKGTRT